MPSLPPILLPVLHHSLINLSFLHQTPSSSIFIPPPSPSASNSQPHYRFFSFSLLLPLFFSRHNFLLLLLIRLSSFSGPVPFLPPHVSRALPFHFPPHISLFILPLSHPSSFSLPPESFIMLVLFLTLLLLLVLSSPFSVYFILYSIQPLSVPHLRLPACPFLRSLLLLYLITLIFTRPLSPLSTSSPLSFVAHPIIPSPSLLSFTIPRSYCFTQNIHHLISLLLISLSPTLAFFPFSSSSFSSPFSFSYHYLSLYSSCTLFKLIFTWPDPLFPSIHLIISFPPPRSLFFLLFLFFRPPASPLLPERPD